VKTCETLKTLDSGKFPSPSFNKTLPIAFARLKLVVNAHTISRFRTLWFS